jgi:hypothetical protein
MSLQLFPVRLQCVPSSFAVHLSLASSHASLQLSSQSPMLALQGSPACPHAPLEQVSAPLHHWPSSQLDPLFASAKPHTCEAHAATLQTGGTAGH